MIIYFVKAYVSSSQQHKGTNTQIDGHWSYAGWLFRHLGHNMKYKLPQPQSKDVITTVAKHYPVTIKQNVKLIITLKSLKLVSEQNEL